MKIRFRTLSILALLPLWLNAATPLSAGDFCVSPTGNDANPGTKSKPFASLTRARDAVRDQKQRKPNHNYTVLLRNGVYRLDKTLVFSLEDSAVAGHTITYAAYPGETPVLSSGVPLRNWKRLEKEPTNLPATARGKVWVTDAPAGIEKICSLYDGMERLPRARGEGFTPPEFVKPEQSADSVSFSTRDAEELARPQGRGGVGHPELRL